MAFDVVAVVDPDPDSRRDESAAAASSLRRRLATGATGRTSKINDSTGTSTSVCWSASPARVQETICGNVTVL